MTALPAATVIQSIVQLLTEAYSGPPDPRETWFVDNEPDSGIFGLLDTISAAEASYSVDGSQEVGSTIAAQVEHLRWSLANASGALRGQPYNSNWGKSWKLISADAGRWDQLRGALRAEFETLRSALLEQDDLPGVYLNGVLALIPHAAFHLGIMRQMIERARAAQADGAQGSKAVVEPLTVDLPKTIGSPAWSALVAAGYTRLEQLDGLREADLLRLHGVGPKAIRLLRDALAERGLSFAED